MTIVEFLEARIAEDEADARAANEGRLLAWSKNDHMVIVDSGFMQTFTPSRILREVAAKRAIISNHGIDQDLCDSHDAMYESVPCDVILNLAAIYSGHPDYQAEWAIP